MYPFENSTAAETQIPTERFSRPAHRVARRAERNRATGETGKAWCAKEAAGESW